MNFWIFYENVNKSNGKDMYKYERTRYAEDDFIYNNNNNNNNNNNKYILKTSLCSCL